MPGASCRTVCDRVDRRRDVARVARRRCASDTDRGRDGRAGMEAIAVERALTASSAPGSRSVNRWLRIRCHDLIQQRCLERSRPVEPDGWRPGGVAESNWAGDDEQLLLEALEHQHLAGGPRWSSRPGSSSRHAGLEVGALARLASVSGRRRPSNRRGATAREVSRRLASGRTTRGSIATLVGMRIDRGRPVPVGTHRCARRKPRLSSPGPETHGSIGNRARRVLRRAAVLEVETLAQEAAIYKFLEHQPQNPRCSRASWRGGTHNRHEWNGSLERQPTTPCSGCSSPPRWPCCSATSEEMLALAGELEMAATGFDDAVHIHARRGCSRLDSRLEHRCRSPTSSGVGHGPPEDPASGTLEGRRRTRKRPGLDGPPSGSRRHLARLRRPRPRLEEFRPSRTFALVPPHQLELPEAIGEPPWMDFPPPQRWKPIRTIARAPIANRPLRSPGLDPANGAEEVRDAVAEAMQDAQSAACVRCQAENALCAAQRPWRGSAIRPGACSLVVWPRSRRRTRQRLGGAPGRDPERERRLR